MPRQTDSHYERDHHGRNFAMWMAGGGVKKGFSLGETDDYSYNIVSDPIGVPIRLLRNEMIELGGATETIMVKTVIELWRETWRKK